MYCFNCSKQLPDTTKICFYCGKEQAGTEHSPEVVINGEEKEINHKGKLAISIPMLLVLLLPTAGISLFLLHLMDSDYPVLLMNLALTGWSLVVIILSSLIKRKADSRLIAFVLKLGTVVWLVYLVLFLTGGYQ